MHGGELIKKVLLNFGGDDVYEIAERAGVKIIYEKWFPATAGEFHRKTKTIVVNENAAIPPEKIVAHELGHYFLTEFEWQRISKGTGCFDEEKFCDEFADCLLRNFEKTT